MLPFFPRDVLDEILDLTESVSEGFLPTLLFGIQTIPVSVTFRENST